MFHSLLLGGKVAFFMHIEIGYFKSKYFFSPSFLCASMEEST
jgi:hypothetical protein